MLKPQTLGQRIAQARREKAARDQRDITRMDVAIAADVSKASMSRYESDIDTPRDPVLARIAAYLGVTPAYLRYGVPDTTRPALESRPEDIDEKAVALTAAQKARAVEKAAAKEAAARRAATSAPRARRRNGGAGRGPASA